MSLPADLLDALAEVRRGVLRYHAQDRLEDDLDSLWYGPAVRVDEPTVFYQSLPDKEPAPVWLIAMTKTFKKDIDKIDKNLRGRILDALREISDNPMLVRGDTV